MIEFLTGLLMSTVHVISGPNRKKSWHIGFFWGCGHVLGMMMIGGLYLAFKEFIPVDKISGYSEYLVGIVLIGIGIWAIMKVLRPFHFHHKHPHYHPSPEPLVHIHSHEHNAEFEHSHTHKKAHRQNNITALSVGTLHGFAGISHFLLILPTLTLPSMHESVLYLSGFAVGTIGTMATFALIMGLIAMKTENFAKSRTFRIMRLSAGVIAIGVGIYWLT
jgi:ABC-type nickel/cobalt efflux system permease component RcnA